MFQGCAFLTDCQGVNVSRPQGVLSVFEPVRTLSYVYCTDKRYTLTPLVAVSTRASRDPYDNTDIFSETYFVVRDRLFLRLVIESIRSLPHLDF